MQTPIKTIPTCPVLGVPLAVTDYAEAVALTYSWAIESGPDRPAVRAVAAANTHVVALARRDPAFREALARFDMIVPDGMPLVWVMNRRGAGLRDRVYGPALMLAAVAQPGVSHFLLGGTAEMLADLEANLRKKFPDLRIAGSHAPPFGSWPAGEDAEIFRKIAASGANYIWIGLGCPKQEIWLARNKSKLPPGVYFAIGAAFPFHSGRVRQAPRWLQRIGMEWLFRLLAEPRRLWKRYAVHNSLFLWYLLGDSGGPSDPVR